VKKRNISEIFCIQQSPVLREAINYLNLSTPLNRMTFSLFSHFHHLTRKPFFENRDHLSMTFSLKLFFQLLPLFLRSCRLLCTFNLCAADDILFLISIHLYISPERNLPAEMILAPFSIFFDSGFCLKAK